MVDSSYALFESAGCDVSNKSSNARFIQQLTSLIFSYSVCKSFVDCMRRAFQSFFVYVLCQTYPCRPQQTEPLAAGVSLSQKVGW